MTGNNYFQFTDSLQAVKAAKKNTVFPQKEKFKE